MNRYHDRLIMLLLFDEKRKSEVGVSSLHSAGVALEDLGAEPFVPAAPMSGWSDTSSKAGAPS
jgi:hypothetical protein